ncbi:MAG: NfeD family protein [Planctomycetota bacterium]
MDGTGKVPVHGRFWDVKSQNKIAKGEHMRVACIHGLTLDVEPASKDRSKRRKEQC